MRTFTSSSVACGAAAALLTPVCSLACWQDAERTYGVSADLLYAIGRAESDLNPNAVNLTHRARTSTYDIGLMQINSGHLPTLARYGIDETQLYDPCTNIKVGAWLLARTFERHGVSWVAVGAYNAACTQLKGEACIAARNKYAWRVFQRLPSKNVAPTAEVRPVMRRGPGSALPLIVSIKVSR